MERSTPSWWVSGQEAGQWHWTGLKKRRSNIQIVGVEPTRSGRQWPTGWYAISKGSAQVSFPKSDRSVLDECILVEDHEAFECAREIARLEGIPAGISSGATAAAAIKLAHRPEMKDKTIVVIFASCAERYLSTPLYRDLVTTCRLNRRQNISSRKHISRCLGKCPMLNDCIFPLFLGRTTRRLNC